MRSSSAVAASASVPVSFTDSLLAPSAAMSASVPSAVSPLTPASPFGSRTADTAAKEKEKEREKREKGKAKRRFAHTAAACRHCERGDGPWDKCVVVPGFLVGSCANFHYGSEGWRCSLRSSEFKLYFLLTICFKYLLICYLLEEVLSFRVVFRPHTNHIRKPPENYSKTQNFIR